MIIKKDGTLRPHRFECFDPDNIFKFEFLKNHYHPETRPIINDRRPRPFCYIIDKDRIKELGKGWGAGYFDELVIPSLRTNTTLVIDTSMVLSLDEIKLVINTLENHENITPSYWNDNRLQVIFTLTDRFGTEKDHSAFTIPQYSEYFYYNMSPRLLDNVRKYIDGVPNWPESVSMPSGKYFPLTLYPDINKKFETHIKDMLFLVKQVSLFDIILHQFRPNEIKNEESFSQ